MTYSQPWQCLRVSTETELKKKKKVREAGAQTQAFTSIQCSFQSATREFQGFLTGRSCLLSSKTNHNIEILCAVLFILLPSIFQ